MPDSVVRILLIEDSPTDAELLQATLHRTGAGGFELTWVERLDDALARLDQESFDVLLLDLSLPDSSGLDTLRRARIAAPRLPIVVLTGTHDESLGLAAVHEGVQDYLVKGESDGRQIARAIRYAIERKRSEEQLRQQREWLRVTLTSIGDAVIAFDTAGRISFLNPVAESLTGWTADEALGQPVESVFRIVNEQTRQPADDLVARVLRENRAITLADQTALLTRDGREVAIEDSAAPILDAAGHVVGVVLVFRDVTDRRRAQAALAAAHAEVVAERNRLHAVMETLPVGVALVDAQGGNVRSNREFEQVWGAPRPPARSFGDYVAYKAWWAATGQPVQPEEWASARAVQKGETVVGQEMEIQRFDGTRAFVLNSAAPIRDAQGRIAGSAVAIVDVTERKAAELKLQRENREVALANRILRVFVEETGDALFDKALELVLEGMESRHGVFGYIDERGHLICPSMSKMLDECEVEGKCIHYPPDKWKGLWARALLEKRTLYTNQRPIVPKGHLAIHNNLATPILFQGQVIGLLNLANKKTGYTEQDRELLEAIANRIAPVHYAWIQRKLRENERAAAEQDLRESREDLNRAQAVAHTGSWRLDVRRNELRWSDETHRIFGIPEETPLTYETFLAAVHPEDRQYVHQRWLAALCGEPYDVEHRIVVGDTMKWVRERAEPEFDRQGVLLGGFGTVQDVTERKRAEQALRESEQRYFAIFDKAPYAMALTRIPQAIIAGVNDAFLKLFGHTREEVIGKTSTELGISDPDSQAQVAEELKARGVVRDYECAGATKSGERRILSLNLDWVSIGGEKHILTTIRDITLRRRAEEALRETQARLGWVLEKTGVGTWLNVLPLRQLNWDEQTRRLFFVSPAVEPTIELFWSRLHPDDREPTALAVARALRERTLYEIDHRAVNPDTGEIRWIRSVGQATYPVDGTPAHFDGINYDITERKRAEEALRDSEQRLKRAQEIAHLGSWELDLVHDRLTWSDELYRILGLAPQEFGGTYEASLAAVHPEDRAAVGAAYSGSLREDRNTYESEHRVVRKATGEVRFVHERCEHVRDAAGRIIRSVGTVHDITERKQAEERLRHAQKLESIGVLAGGIAHDFNNLLTSILGNASLLQMDTSAGNGQQLEAIIEASEKAASLTRQLLAYAGKGQFQITDFDVSRLVRSSADLLRVSIPKNVAVQLDVPRNLPLIRGDPSQIQQVVMNLVINAAEAIEGREGGRVSIRAGVRDFDAASANRVGSGAAPGRYVSVAVRDNGCGMDDQTKAKIFDPFFTTKFVGRGLGLAAVHGILSSHRGTITVESSPGQGSTFTVCLPCVAGRAATVCQRAGPARKRAATVLVIEDEEGVRAFTKAALERTGYKVLLAENGRQALELLAGPSGVDLAVLDLVMPVVGGVEAFAEMRNKWPKLAVLVASGYSRQEAKRLGIPGDLPYIEKPYTAQMLAAAVAKALKGHARKRE